MKHGTQTERQKLRHGQKTSNPKARNLRTRPTITP